MTAHVLVGTTPADPARRAELPALARRVGAELAFLQLGSPGLGTVLTRLADDGAARVVLVGVGGATGPGVSWLRRVAAHWWATYGAGAPELLTDVLLTQTGCQLPCNRAPVVTVHPDDVWYGGVDRAAAGAVVAEHLVAGNPVERLRLRRVAAGTTADRAR